VLRCALLFTALRCTVLHCIVLQRAKGPKRPSGLCSNPLALADFHADVVGLPVDLAHVASEAEGAVLSWAAQPFMDCVVTATDAATLGLFQSKGLKTLSMRQINRFMVGEGSQRRARSDAEIKQHNLLPMFELPPGFQYLVNMIKLAPGKEHLRDTLFWHIFKYAVVCKVRGSFIWGCG
jgi:hypothetical protein